MPEIIDNNEDYETSISLVSIIYNQDSDWIRNKYFQLSFFCSDMDTGIIVSL